MRPESSNSASGASSWKPGAAQAASSSNAAPAKRRRTALGAETLEGFLKGLVLRARLQRLLPDAARFVALAERPEHFAEVGADLAVRPPRPSTAQLLRGALQVA